MLVSRDRVTETIRTELRNAVVVERRFTVEQLAGQSGVELRAIRSYMSNDPTEVREPPLSAALSLACVLGPHCVNAILNLIGYVASPAEDAEAGNPARDAANAMAHLARFAQAAADNRIDHTEKPIATEAADHMILILTPYSSLGDAA